MRRESFYAGLIREAANEGETRTVLNPAEGTETPANSTAPYSQPIDPTINTVQPYSPSDDENPGQTVATTCPRCGTPWDIDMTPVCEGCGMSYQDRILSSKTAADLKICANCQHPWHGDKPCGGYANCGCDYSMTKKEVEEVDKNSSKTADGRNLGESLLDLPLEKLVDHLRRDHPTAQVNLDSDDMADLAIGHTDDHNEGAANHTHQSSKTAADDISHLIDAHPSVSGLARAVAEGRNTTLAKDMSVQSLREALRLLHEDAHKRGEKHSSKTSADDDLDAWLDSMDDVKPDDYENPDHKQFINDMRAAGHTPRHYNGRGGWEGPAVDVDDYGEVYQSTKVPVQHDNLGKGYVVYPKARGKKQSSKTAVEDWKQEAYQRALEEVNKHPGKDRPTYREDGSSDPVAGEYMRKLRDLEKLRQLLKNSSKTAGPSPADWQEWRNQPEVLVEHWNKDHAKGDGFFKVEGDGPLADLIDQHNDHHDDNLPSGYEALKKPDHTHGKVRSNNAALTCQEPGCENPATDRVDNGQTAMNVCAKHAEEIRASHGSSPGAGPGGDIMYRGYGAVEAYRNWSESEGWFDAADPIRSLDAHIETARSIREAARSQAIGAENEAVNALYDIDTSLESEIEKLEAVKTEYQTSTQEEYLANLPGGTVAMEYGSLIDGGLADLGPDDGSVLYALASDVNAEAAEYDWDAFQSVGAEHWVIDRMDGSPDSLRHSQLTREAAIDYAKDKTMPILDGRRRAEIVDGFVTNVEKLRRQVASRMNAADEQEDLKVASIDDEDRRVLSVLESVEGANWW